MPVVLIRYASCWVRSTSPKGSTGSWTVSAVTPPCCCRPSLNTVRPANGPGQFAGRTVFNEGLQQQGGVTADTVQLPVDPFGEVDLTQQDAYLIKTTGIYYIVLGDGFTTGAYNFTVQVFDDGDSGFASGNNSGN